VKEADAFSAAGYDVTVLYCHCIDWGEKADKDLLAKVNWKYRLVGGSPSGNPDLFFMTRVRTKLARFFNRYGGNRWGIAERTQARAFDEMLAAARELKADWYIGHNLGALPVAVRAAEFYKAKAGFDFEDYHRGENANALAYENSRTVYLETKYVPRVTYLSAASPLIAEKLAVDFPDRKHSIISLLNCFPLTQQPPFREKSADDDSLQLFWFSQTVGLDRGLELLIEAMVQMNDPDIHLTLVGNCSEDFRQYLESQPGLINSQIKLEGTVTPECLPTFASRFDVGLALEYPKPLNRDICLTNKIFTYLLAGNAVIVSGTSAQKKFNAQYQIGPSYTPNNVRELVDSLRSLKDKKKMEKQRKDNYMLAASQLNWENESNKLLECIGRYSR
jgi:glycosyltransferase involved in cell wall biosynthesis